MQSLKRAGYGNFPVPDYRYQVAYIEAIEMALVVEPRRMYDEREFRVSQLLAAIELLEICSLAREEYGEMWAYVFNGDVQIGFLYVVRGDIGVEFDQRNGTLDVSTS